MARFLSIFVRIDSSFCGGGRGLNVTVRGLDVRLVLIPGGYQSIVPPWHNCFRQSQMLDTHILQI